MFYLFVTLIKNNFEIIPHEKLFAPQTADKTKNTQKFTQNIKIWTISVAAGYQKAS